MWRWRGIIKLYSTFHSNYLKGGNNNKSYNSEAVWKKFLLLVNTRYAYNLETPEKLIPSSPVGFELLSLEWKFECFKFSPMRSQSSPISTRHLLPLCRRQDRRALSYAGRFWRPPERQQRDRGPSLRHRTRISSSSNLVLLRMSSDVSSSKRFTSVAPVSVSNDLSSGSWKPK